jgi:hypothetical protein
MGRLTPQYLGDQWVAAFAAPTASGHDDYVSDPWGVAIPSDC